MPSCSIGKGLNPLSVLRAGVGDIFRPSFDTPYESLGLLCNLVYVKIFSLRLNPTFREERRIYLTPDQG